MGALPWPPMDGTLTLVALVGSLRRGSYSRIVMDAASHLLPAGVTVLEAPLAPVPLYNQDVEEAGAPPEVTGVQDLVSDADGLLIFTPEYNRSMPAVTKNAVDWLSRPYGAAPIRDKPVGIVAVVPGRHHGEGVRGHLSATVSVLTTNLFDPTLGISSVRHRIEDDRLSDEEAIAELRAWLTSFVDFVHSQTGGPESP